MECGVDTKNYSI